MMADVSTNRVANLVLFKVLSPQASEWVTDNVIEEHERRGAYVLVEPQYAEEIIHGMLEEGLEVTTH